VDKQNIWNILFIILHSDRVIAEQLFAQVGFSISAMKKILLYLLIKNQFVFRYEVFKLTQRINKCEIENYFSKQAPIV